MGRHATTEITEQLDIEPTLRLPGVEIYLQGGDSGITGDIDNSVCRERFEFPDNHSGRLDTDDRDAPGSCGIKIRLSARDNVHCATENERSIKSGDGRSARIDGAKVLPALPDPQGNRRQTMHPAWWWHEIERVGAKQ